jgi:hypothetical protein
MRKRNAYVTLGVSALYLFPLRPSRLEALPLHRNKSQGHNSRGPDDTLSSLAV